MNNFDYKYMTPFKWFVLENFPFIENDFEAINNYRLFSKVVEYLNKMKDNVNLTGQQMENLTNAMIELQDYVNNYFNNLDIQDEINNKLDEMATDGTLENIINQEIFGELNNKVDNEKLYGMKINSTRLYRKLIENGLNTMKTGDFYAFGQGFCMINENKCVMALTNNVDNSNNNARIIEINLTNGSILREVIAPFGHCNGLSYNPDDGLIYIAGCSTKNPQTGALIRSNKLFILTYEDFSYSNVEISTEITGISYDKISKKLYASINNENDASIMELNKENYTIINTINLITNTVTSSGRQNIVVNDNKIYRILANPNVIKLYNIDGSFINNFVFNEFMDESYFIGELQDIDIIGDYIYFNSSIFENVDCPLSIVNIGKTSLTKNIINNNFFSQYPYRNITLYIDNTTENFNPNGTTNNKFNELLEAVYFLESPTGKRFKSVINFNNSNIEYSGCKISCNNITRIDFNTITIGHLTLSGISNINLTRVFIKGTIANLANLIISNCGVVNLFRPNFVNNNNNNTNAIYIENSIVYITCGKSAMGQDTFDNLLINLVNSAKLYTKNFDLNNILKADTTSIVDKFSIFKGNITAIENYNYTSIISNMRDELSKYNYINFVINMPACKKTVKLNTNNIIYRITENRSSDSTTALWIRLYMYVVQINQSNFSVTNAKQITQNIDEGTNYYTNDLTECPLLEIFLSDI